MVVSVVVYTVQQLRREPLARRMTDGSPTTARVLDYGDHAGQVWVATEFITGTNAEELLLRRFPSGIPHRSLRVIADHIAVSLDETARLGGCTVSSSRPISFCPDHFRKNYRIAITDFGQQYAGITSAEGRYGAPDGHDCHRVLTRHGQVRDRTRCWWHGCRGWVLRRGIVGRWG